DQAQIGRARRRPQRLGLEFMAGLVQVDLLPPEAQRLAAGTEGLHLQAKDAAIEGAAAFDAGDGEDQMVQMADGDHPRLLAWSGMVIGPDTRRREAVPACGCREAVPPTPAGRIRKGGGRRGLTPGWPRSGATGWHRAAPCATPSGRPDPPAPGGPRYPRRWCSGTRNC